MNGSPSELEYAAGHKAELVQMMKNIIVMTMNSPLHIMTQRNREAYLNNSWRLIKEYERKPLDPRDFVAAR